MTKTLALVAALGLVVSAPAFAADDSSKTTTEKSTETKADGTVKADSKTKTEVTKADGSKASSETKTKSTDKSDSK